MKKAKLEALIKNSIDQEVKEQINNLKAQLEQRGQELDQILDIAEDRGLSSALYMQFVTKNNLMDEFKKFLEEHNKKQEAQLRMNNR